MKYKKPREPEGTKRKCRGQFMQLVGFLAGVQHYSKLNVRPRLNHVRQLEKPRPQSRFVQLQINPHVSQVKISHPLTARREDRPVSIAPQTQFRWRTLHPNTQTQSRGAGSFVRRRCQCRRLVHSCQATLRETLVFEGRSCARTPHRRRICLKGSIDPIPLIFCFEHVSLKLITHFTNGAKLNPHRVAGGNHRHEFIVGILELRGDLSRKPSADTPLTRLTQILTADERLERVKKADSDARVSEGFHRMTLHRVADYTTAVPRQETLPEIVDSSAQVVDEELSSTALTIRLDLLVQHGWGDGPPVGVTDRHMQAAQNFHITQLDVTQFATIQGTGHRSYVQETRLYSLTLSAQQPRMRRRFHRT
jgi:hypothetical protein